MWSVSGSSCAFIPLKHVNFILPVHVANLLQKTVKLVLPRDNTDCTSSRGKTVSLAREWLKCETSDSVTVPVQQGKSSECVGYVARELHPQAGAFVDALLASELTIHLQQFPSPPPLYRLSE